MRLKRATDLTIGVLALIATSPVLVLAALAVKLTSPGPVLHRAERVGRDGRPFTLLKLRTMRDGGLTGPRVTSAGDLRVTPVGRFLRRYKIDELPQLINVLRGDMSLVGPRPEDPRFVERYSDEERRVLRLRPGITGPAAIAFRDEERLLQKADVDVEGAYLREVMPAKLRLDLTYIDERSFWSDVRILIRTALSILLPRRKGSGV